MQDPQPPAEFSIITKRTVVPNQQPLDPTPCDYKIAIVGEAPGEDEEAYGRPFIGKSGALLDNILRSVDIDRNKCFVGNVCQVRPPANRIEAFAWNSEPIQSGIAQLTADLAIFNPNICLLLGNTPLRAARGPSKITSWRGSLFYGNEIGPFTLRKCIASLHPAFILREFSSFPLLKFDCKRARDEGESNTLILPSRELITDLSATLLCHLMDTWPTGLRCSVDIEGGIKENVYKGWACVSICASPTRSYTIPWGRLSESDHCRVLHSFANLMARRDVPKVLQNGLYDNFVLVWGYAILIRNVSEETLIKSWEIYAELPRALEVQASIWTREPHWKDDSMYKGSGEGLYRGCAIDTAVTLEICDAQDGALSPLSKIHYRKMVEMLNPFLYMQVRGIKYDSTAAAKKLVDIHTGYTETNTKTGDTKHIDGLVEIANRLIASAKRDFRGKKGSLSSKQLAEVLYVEKKYPPQYKKELGRKTDKLTTDVEALLTLKKQFPDDQFITDILTHRHLEGVRETLNVRCDPDGRIRCGYSLEAETGRVKCYTSPTGNGTNLQTIQKFLRGNYIADDGCDFAQLDLEGADGWTVASHCAKFGDSTMIDDYLAGMKPAKIIALLYFFGPVINDLDRDSVKFLHDKVFPLISKIVGKWLYLGCKRVQHGSNYLMGIPTMCLNVLKDSYKESGIPIYMPPADARILQDLYHARYPGVKLWHYWAEHKLVGDGKLTSASGHTRLFFGRRFGSYIQETVKEFLAHEPQNNTTWATNLAMLKLWNDPANRIKQVNQWSVETCDGAAHYWTGSVDQLRAYRPGMLLIEPLHQVHDALCPQWPTCLRDWARGKVRSYFQNPLTIAGRTITIPFDGGYGKSWLDTENSI